MKDTSKNIIIIVLGGALKKTKTGWRTTHFQDKGDLFGVSGDRLRVLATMELYQSFIKKEKNAHVSIVASGGKGQYIHMKVPFLSRVIKKELMEGGLPARAIIEESKSNNTFEQLQESAKILKNKNVNTAILISSRHHLPRIKAFIKYDKSLKGTLNKLQLKSAESILINANPKRWKRSIELAHQSKAMKERVRLEKKGIQQIKNGTYDFTIGPKKLMYKK